MGCSSQPSSAPPCSTASRPQHLNVCVCAYVQARACIPTQQLHGTQTFAEAGLTAADLASFFLFFDTLLDIFGRIKWHYDVLRDEFSDIEQLLALMEARPAVVSGPRALELAQVGWEIEFKDVRCYSYPAETGKRSAHELIQVITELLLVELAH